MDPSFFYFVVYAGYVVLKYFTINLNEIGVFVTMKGASVKIAKYSNNLRKMVNKYCLIKLSYTNVNLGYNKVCHNLNF